MTTDLVRYDLLVQDALRGVVRTVLADAAKNGLQGDHHFFITFKTTAPGLRLSNRMRGRYPEEMTIILQHQFWDLAVTEHAFEVGLSFSNVPERLLVPFAAITSFVDPSVQFGLKFEVQDVEAGDDGSAEEAEKDSTPLPGPGAPSRALAPVAPLAASPVPAVRLHDEAPKADAIKPQAVRSVDTATPPAGDGKAARTGDGGDPTKVISIDAFRKKP